MPFLPPNQQRQSNEGNLLGKYCRKFLGGYFFATPCRDIVLLQTRIQQSIQAAIDGSQQESRSIHLEIRPQFLVPDTNCFIDHLQGIAALLATRRFTVVVPLIGLFNSLRCL